MAGKNSCSLPQILIYSSLLLSFFLFFFVVAVFANVIINVNIQLTINVINSDTSQLLSMS